jgi:hypothetical protein
LIKAKIDWRYQFCKEKTKGAPRQGLLQLTLILSLYQTMSLNQLKKFNKRSHDQITGATAG